MRTEDDRGRTNLLLDLGIQPTTKVAGSHSWLIAGAIVAWIINIANSAGWILGWNWIPFLIFATRLVSVLTSPSVIEQLPGHISEKRKL